MLLLSTIISRFFFVYMLLLFVRIFGSWFPELQRTRFMQFVAFCVDPYLNFFRGILPPFGMLDLSPILAFFALNVLEWVVQNLIILIAVALA